MIEKERQRQNRKRERIREIPCVEVQRKKKKLWLVMNLHIEEDGEAKCAAFVELQSPTCLEPPPEMAQKAPVPPIPLGPVYCSVGGRRGSWAQKDEQVFNRQ